MALALAAVAQIVAFAPTASAQSGGWQPGPGAALDNTYAGFVDVPSSGGTVPGSGSFAVAGWFVDSSAQGWAGADDVQVWLGSMDGGGSGTSTAAPAPAAGGTPTLSITNPIEAQNVSTKSDYTINGKASPGAAIDVWINGERNTHYATELGTTTAAGDGSWSLTFIPTHFPSTHSNLYVYAKDASSGVETLLSVGFNIVDK